MLTRTSRIHNKLSKYVKISDRHRVEYKFELIGIIIQQDHFCSSCDSKNIQSWNDYVKFYNAYFVSLAPNKAVSA